MVIGRLVIPDMDAVIFAVPTATAVAKPVEEIVAAAGVSLAQVTWELISAVEPSQLIPVTEYCCVAPTAIVTGTAGPTTIEDSDITVIVKLWLVTPFRVAVISVVPSAKPVTMPILQVATPGLELAQITSLVRSGVRPLE